MFGSATRTCKYWDDPSKAFPGTSAGFWFTEMGPDVWEKPHSWTWKRGPLHLGRKTLVFVAKQDNSSWAGRVENRESGAGLSLVCGAQQVNVKAKPPVS